jgi:hypothetical protein
MLDDQELNIEHGVGMECIGEGLVSKASPNLRVVALRVIGQGCRPKNYRRPMGAGSFLYF